MYLVFKCRKCGHELYMDSYTRSIVWRTFKELSERDCPECGEDGYENWILAGARRTCPVDDVQEEED